MSDAPDFADGGSLCECGCTERRHSTGRDPRQCEDCDCLAFTLGKTEIEVEGMYEREPGELRALPPGERSVEITLMAELTDELTDELRDFVLRNARHAGLEGALEIVPHPDNPGVLIGDEWVPSAYGYAWRYAVKETGA